MCSVEWGSYWARGKYLKEGPTLNHYGNFLLAWKCKTCNPIQYSAVHQVNLNTCLHTMDGSSVGLETAISQVISFLSL